MPGVRREGQRSSEEEPLKVFRYPLLQTAQPSRSRRLAESNRCHVPLETAQPCGSRLERPLAADFVTPEDATEGGSSTTGAADWRMPATVQGQCTGCGAAYQSGRRPRPEATPDSVTHDPGELHLARPIAAASSGEASPPTSGARHSSARDHRGGLRLHGAARPHRTLRHLADLAGRSTLPVPAQLAAGCVLHPPARVGRLAPAMGRLDRTAVDLRRRDAVHAVDVAGRRRRRRAVGVVCA
jgi:hypothetical protein